MKPALDFPGFKVSPVDFDLIGTFFNPRKGIRLTGSWTDDGTVASFDERINGFPVMSFGIRKITHVVATIQRGSDIVNHAPGTSRAWRTRVTVPTPNPKLPGNHQYAGPLSMDQDGFCWHDSKGQKCDVNQVLENAIEILCSLIL
jgi:hypothetical protein